MYLLNGVCYDDQHPPKMNEIPWLNDLSWLQGAHLFETIICYQVLHDQDDNASSTNLSSAQLSSFICYFRLSAHIDRLMAGAKYLGFSVHVQDVYKDFECLRQRHLSQMNPLQDRSVIRYILTPTQRSLFVQSPRPQKVGAINPKIVDLCHFPMSPDLPRWLKHGSRGEWVARKRSKQVDELILIDEDGFILEGDSSAVFVIYQNTIYLPPQTDKMLHSISRLACIDLFNIANLPYHIQPIHASSNFESAFLAGTIKEIVPIGQWGNRKLNTHHPLFLQLLKLWQIYTQRFDFCH
jgi:branched-subunit amino acid aminotransferase/4-amino-4-deoxychorismate lyase